MIYVTRGVVTISCRNCDMRFCDRGNMGDSYNDPGSRAPVYHEVHRVVVIRALGVMDTGKVAVMVLDVQDPSVILQKRPTSHLARRATVTKQMTALAEPSYRIVSRGGCVNGSSLRT